DQVYTLSFRLACAGAVSLNCGAPARVSNSLPRSANQDRSRQRPVRAGAADPAGADNLSTPCAFHKNAPEQTAKIIRLRKPYDHTCSIWPQDRQISSHGLRLRAEK